MTTSPRLDKELDLQLLTVEVDGVEIQHRAGRDVGGVTAMAPDEPYQDPRIRDVAGTFVGWQKDVSPVDTGASGVISVLLGSPSATYLAKLASSRMEVPIVFTSNGSGLGFETQTLASAKMSNSSIAIEKNGIRMFPFVGWDYDEVPVA